MRFPSLSIGPMSTQMQKRSFFAVNQSCFYSHVCEWLTGRENVSRTGGVIANSRPLTALSDRSSAGQLQFKFADIAVTESSRNLGTSARYKKNCPRIRMAVDRTMANIAHPLLTLLASLTRQELAQ